MNYNARSNSLAIHQLFSTKRFARICALCVVVAWRPHGNSGSIVARCSRSLRGRNDMTTLLNLAVAGILSTHTVSQP